VISTITVLRCTVDWFLSNSVACFLLNNICFRGRR